MSVSIAPSVRECMKAFKRVVSAQGVDEMPIDALEEEFGRFRIWAGNVSAHTTGRRSLEYRLRDSSELATAVAGYLQRLRDTLAEVNEPSSSLGADTTSELDESDSDLFADEGFGDDTTSSVLVEDIAMIISSLFRISSALRNPARKDQVRYANDVNTQHFEPYDIEHVRGKFKAASATLTVRLGKTISRHRQFFKYHEEHHNKLSAGLDDFEDVQTVLRGPSTIATSVHQQIRDLAVSLNVTDENQSVYTATSYAQTDSGASTLAPPPWPENARDNKLFECPLCYYIISTPNEQAWKQHVYEDIPPFVCTQDDCDAVTRQFSRRRDWLHHMKEHGNRWMCPTGCSVPLNSPRAFEEHLQTAHPATLTTMPLPGLLISCAMEGTSHQSVECPLCNETKPSTIQLYKHIGRHLEQLALFAVPQHLLGDNEDNVSDDNHNDPDILSPQNSDSEAGDGSRRRQPNTAADSDAEAHLQHHFFPEKQSAEVAETNVVDAIMEGDHEGKQDPQPAIPDLGGPDPSTQQIEPEQGRIDRDSHAYWGDEPFDAYGRPLHRRPSPHNNRSGDSFFDPAYGARLYRSSSTGAKPRPQISVYSTADQDDENIFQPWSGSQDRSDALPAGHSRSRGFDVDGLLSAELADMALEHLSGNPRERGRSDKPAYDSDPAGDAEHRLAPQEELHWLSRASHEGNKDRADLPESASDKDIPRGVREDLDIDEGLSKEFERREQVRGGREGMEWEEAQQQREEQEAKKTLKKQIAEEVARSGMRELRDIKALDSKAQPIESMAKEEMRKNAQRETATSERKPAVDWNAPTRAPVYPKIHKDHIELKTLEYYQLPWHYDRADPNFIIVQRDMDQRHVDVLFEHTARTRKGILLLEPTIRQQKAAALAEESPTPGSVEAASIPRSVSELSDRLSSSFDEATGRASSSVELMSPNEKEESQRYSGSSNEFADTEHVGSYWTLEVNDAFSLYHQNKQAEVALQNPGFTKAEMDTRLGEQWSALGLETRERWEKIAEKENALQQNLSFPWQ